MMRVTRVRNLQNKGNVPTQPSTSLPVTVSSPVASVVSYKSLS